jgi:hypothetical protein
MFDPENGAEPVRPVFVKTSFVQPAKSPPSKPPLVKKARAEALKIRSAAAVVVRSVSLDLLIWIMAGEPSKVP